MNKSIKIYIQKFKNIAKDCFQRQMNYGAIDFIELKKKFIKLLYYAGIYKIMMTLVVYDRLMVCYCLKPLCSGIDLYFYHQICVLMIKQRILKED